MREAFWIKRLNIFVPCGLNMNLELFFISKVSKLVMQVIKIEAKHANVKCVYVDMGMSIADTAKNVSSPK